MKRFLAVVVGLAMCGLVGYRVSHGVSAAQAAGQFSSQPQMRYAANVAIPIGTPVISTTSGCAQTSECVTPTTTTGFIAGISITANVANGPVYIAQYGSALCSFDSAANLGDSVTVAPGFCHDEPVNTRTNISFLAGYIGRVIAIPNQSICPSTYCAYVNIIAPGTTGLAVTASQMDASMPAYVKANQNTSAGPQGNPGQAATVSIGTTNTGPAAVTNSGTSSAAVLNFTVPQGVPGPASTVPGPTGPASTVPGPAGQNAANPAFTASATGLAAGANPTVTLSGTYPAQNLAFAIPAGAIGAASTVAGPQGIQGISGAAATVSVGTVTTLACSASPTVSNGGTALAAVLNFGIPVCADLIGTGTIPAATLVVAGCSAAVVIPVTGAVVGRRVDVMTASGLLPTTNTYLAGSVTSAGNVSAVQCGTVALTLPSLAVRVSVGP